MIRHQKAAKWIAVLMVICLSIAGASTSFAVDDTDSTAALAEAALEAVSEENSDFMENAVLSSVASDGTLEFEISTDLEVPVAVDALETANGADEPALTAVGHVTVIPLTEKAGEELLAAVSAGEAVKQPAYGNIPIPNHAVSMETLTVYQTGRSSNRDCYRLLAVQGTVKTTGSGSVIGDGLTIVGNRVTYGTIGEGPNGFVNEMYKVDVGNENRRYLYAPSAGWIFDPVKSSNYLGQDWTLWLGKGNNTISKTVSNVCRVGSV